MDIIIDTRFFYDLKDFLQEVSNSENWMYESKYGRYGEYQERSWVGKDDIDNAAKELLERLENYVRDI